jgi:hypothetical protein
MAAQREFVTTRSPAYARLLDLLEAELDRGLEARLDGVWRERSFRAFYERPLLLLAALRNDALREGRAHPLWPAVAAPTPDPSTLAAPAVREALDPARRRLWRTLAERHVQTNEPSRAVAWLWPAHLAARATVARPLALVDVGASAGLNLVADRLPPAWEASDGSPLPVAPRAAVASRVGFDPRPLDALDEDDARWLRACVWPGHGDREARLAAALDEFRALRSGPGGPEVQPVPARDVPGRLPGPDDGRLTIVYQTVVRDYVPPAEWRAYEEGLRHWIEERPRGSSLWVELEVTGEPNPARPPAAITAHVRGPTGLASLVLACCEPHPRRLSVDPGAVDELVTALGG